MNQVGGCKLGGCWCVQKKKRRKRKAEKKNLSIHEQAQGRRLCIGRN
jgi:hypothetical protein